MAKDLKRLAAWGRGKKDGPPEDAPAQSRTLEEACAAEMGEAETAFRARMKQEDRRRRDATDSEYWCAMVFQSREQCNAFLRAAGWLRAGDKYIDGRFVAKKMGIRLPDPEAKPADPHQR